MSSSSSSAAARYEAVRLRHRRLLDVHSASSNDGGVENDHDHNASAALAAGQMMSSRAGVVSVLDRSIAEATSSSSSLGVGDHEPEQQPADVRQLMALLDTTLPSADGGITSGEVASWAALAAKSNRDHPVAISKASSSARSASRQGVTANDFFAEYPECIRTDYSDDDDSSSSSSEGSAAEEDVANADHRANDDVVYVKQEPSQYPQQQPSQQQQPTPASQPQLNPYLYGGSSQESNNANNVAGGGANHSNPYNSVPIGPPAVAAASVSAAAASAASWNDYEPPPRAPGGYRHNGGGGGTIHGGGNGNGIANNNGGKGANPFQTAREFAGAADNNNDNGANSGHNNNGRNNPYGTGNNPYGGHGSNNSSNNNPYGNPYQANGSHAAPSAPLPSTLNRPEISAGLKRKFQPPKRIGGGAGGAGVGKDTKMVGRKVYGGNNNHKGGGSGGGGGTVARPSSSGGRGGSGGNGNPEEDDEELPEELQGLDKELVNKIMNEIVDNGESITFDDIAGLADAKQTVLELVCWPMKRPDLFTGLRRGPNGLLLFGPPGTGKTLIGKAIAHESGACFFSISSSSLTSKWIGEGEKLVKTLFKVAAFREPAVVFIDEIDSLLTARKADENEASRRIKTEFLVQLDGTGTGQGRLLCIGATNRPHELDDAARRRFVKRLYIPLPEQPDREILLRTLLKKNTHSLSDEEITKLSGATHGYSGADLKALCNDAAMGPIRDLGPTAMDIGVDDVPPISYKHFRRSLKGMNPSVSEEDLDDYIKFNDTYGNKHREDNDDDDDEDDSD